MRRWSEGGWWGRWGLGCHGGFFLSFFLSRCGCWLVGWCLLSAVWGSDRESLKLVCDDHTC